MRLPAATEGGRWARLGGPHHALGDCVAALVDVVVTSVVTGYEKPKPKAFEQNCQMAGRPATVWMVGDNAIADVDGA